MYSHDLPDLDYLESFGWILQPTLPPRGGLTRDEVIARVQPDPSTTISAHPVLYSEKGRFRLTTAGTRDTLYRDRPVWVVTISTDHSVAVRHIIVDAVSGRVLTAFVGQSSGGTIESWDLQAPLDGPELDAGQALEAVFAGGEDAALREVPAVTEYGSWWRLIPGFLQAIDVWKVTFDTSSLHRDIPGTGGAGLGEASRLVLVDDKAGHAWLSTSVPRQ